MAEFFAELLIDLAADVAEIFGDNALNRWLEKKKKRAAGKKAESEEHG